MCDSSLELSTVFSKFIKRMIPNWQFICRFQFTFVSHFSFQSLSSFSMSAEVPESKSWTDDIPVCFYTGSILDQL